MPDMSCLSICVKKQGCKASSEFSVPSWDLSMLGLTSGVLFYWGGPNNRTYLGFLSWADQILPGRTFQASCWGMQAWLSVLWRANGAKGQGSHHSLYQSFTSYSFSA